MEFCNDNFWIYSTENVFLRSRAISSFKLIALHHRLLCNGLKSDDIIKRGFVFLR